MNDVGSNNAIPTASSRFGGYIFHVPHFLPNKSLIRSSILENGGQLADSPSANAINLISSQDWKEGKGNRDFAWYDIGLISDALKYTYLPKLPAYKFRQTPHAVGTPSVMPLTGRAFDRKDTVAIRKYIFSQERPNLDGNLLYEEIVRKNICAGPMEEIRTFVLDELIPRIHANYKSQDAEIPVQFLRRQDKILLGIYDSSLDEDGEKPIIVQKKTPYKTLSGTPIQILKREKDFSPIKERPYMTLTGTPINKISHNTLSENPEKGIDLSSPTRPTELETEAYVDEIDFGESMSEKRKATQATYLDLPEPAIKQKKVNEIDLEESQNAAPVLLDSRKDSMYEVIVDWKKSTLQSDEAVQAVKHKLDEIRKGLDEIIDEYQVPEILLFHALLANNGNVRAALSYLESGDAVIFDAADDILLRTSSNVKDIDSIRHKYGHKRVRERLAYLQGYQ